MKTLYSIGHSNLDIQKFIALLTGYKIDCLVDIRSVPYSRFCPQFNKAKIEISLQAHNIHYIYQGSNLGGRITDPACYINNLIPARKVNMAETINYDVLKTRSWFSEGIHTLIQLTEQYKTAIMCSEEDPDRCHRKLLVGKRLAEEGFQIIHIRSKPEKALPGNLDLFD